MHSPLTLEVLNSEETLRIESFDAIVAGYTGRDSEQVQAHIDELAEIGVPPPPQVPMFYPVDAQTVTTDEAITVTGDSTSGEIEPVYIRHQGEYYLGVASDHTDRQIETEDIAASKKACPKPISGMVLKVSDFDQLDLDDVRVECFVDGQLYQQGTLDGLLPPQSVVQKLQQSSSRSAGDFICLGGTLPLQTSGFIYGTTWKLQMTVGDSVISHTYNVQKEKN